MNALIIIAVGSPSLSAWQKFSSALTVKVNATNSCSLYRREELRESDCSDILLHFNSTSHWRLLKLKNISFQTDYGKGFSRSSKLKLPSDLLRMKRREKNGIFIEISARSPCCPRPWWNLSILACRFANIAIDAAVLKLSVYKRTFGNVWHSFRDVI